MIKLKYNSFDPSIAIRERYNDNRNSYWVVIYEYLPTVQNLLTRY